MTKAKASTETVTAPAVTTSTKGKTTVTVACKIPTGLELQLCKETTWPEGTPSGTIMRTRFDRVGPTVLIRGTAYPEGPKPKGFPPPPLMAGGYAITPNVPADFFAEWMKQNADNPVVVNKMIFAHENRDRVLGLATDNKETKSGFEPLTPDDDPRMPKSINPGITTVATADEFANRIPASEQA